CPRVCHSCFQLWSDNRWSLQAARVLLILGFAHAIGFRPASPSPAHLFSSLMVPRRGIGTNPSLLRRGYQLRGQNALVIQEPEIVAPHRQGSAAAMAVAAAALKFGQVSADSSLTGRPRWRACQLMRASDSSLMALIVASSTVRPTTVMPWPSISTTSLPFMMRIMS